MSEVNFFMDLDDTRGFVAFLLDRFDAELALDRSTTPEPSVYRTLDSISRTIERDPYGPRFFVTSSQWKLFPLSVSEVHTNDGRHFYSIDQRYGGPAFDFKIGRCDASRFLIPGWFSDYPYYYCRKGSPDTLDRPEEFEAAFNHVRRYLRGLGVKSDCRETGKPGPWVLPGGASLHASGAWLRQGDWHFDPRSAA